VETGDIVLVRYGRQNSDGPSVTGGLPLYVLDDSVERSSDISPRGQKPPLRLLLTDVGFVMFHRPSDGRMRECSRVGPEDAKLVV
jgi:hypothetical protein